MQNGWKVALVSDPQKTVVGHFGSEYFYKILPDTETLCRKFRYKKDALTCANEIVKLGGEAKITKWNA
jgi:hypothetical protein